MTGSVDKILYGDNFYQSQMDGSYRSAVAYAKMMATLQRFPSRVADVGCGRGTWLKAFREHGAQVTVGFDGSWNSQANMVDGNIRFIACDLSEKLPESTERFDLALSLEVAEHVSESSSDVFVTNLVGLADVVIFSAAFTGQGGTNHVNEQRPSYWAKKFKTHGYDVYDAFRPTVWGNGEVEFWYQQNAFLYVRRSTHLTEALRLAAVEPLQNLDFMDCIHPVMANLLVKNISVRALFKQRLKDRFRI